MCSWSYSTTTSVWQPQTETYLLIFLFLSKEPWTIYEKLWANCLENKLQFRWRVSRQVSQLTSELLPPISPPIWNSFTESIMILVSLSLYFTCIVFFYCFSVFSVFYLLFLVFIFLIIFFIFLGRPYSFIIVFAVLCCLLA